MREPSRESQTTGLTVPIDGRILYFARDRESFGFLSHFHPSRFRLDGEEWPTVEHFYQAQKSGDPDYHEAIRSAASPAKAKRLAAHPDAPRRISQGSWFRKNSARPRSDWRDMKLYVMRRADGAKFNQNPELAAMLLATGTAVLIEDSPFEPFWGLGPNGDGLNWAGRILMDVRECLMCAR